MKIVIAPDSFKESVSAKEAALAIRKGVLQAMPDAECIIVPMADGGEGTVQALTEGSQGEMIRTKVHGPMMTLVDAFWGKMGDQKTAVIEMAAASGLALVPREHRDPMHSSTYGTGELIIEALEAGCKHIIMGIGGSATNDAGAGMLQALGYRLLDASGNDLPKGGAALSELDRIDASHRHPLLNSATFEVACDVDNPLCGVRGASAVYGPQKGATPYMVSRLDEALEHFASIIKSYNGKDILNVPGAGAAGGIGAGLMAFLDAKLNKGVEIVIRSSGLEKFIAQADLVITGEGKMDEQTQYGKTPFGVSQLALRYGVPCIGVCGMLGKGADILYQKGFSSLFCIADGPMSLEDSMKNASDLLSRTTCNIMRTYNIKRS